MTPQCRAIHFWTNIFHSVSVVRKETRSAQPPHDDFQQQRSGSWYYDQLQTLKCVGWFPLISKNDSERLERYQTQCLRVIYPDIDNTEIRLKTIKLDNICLNLNTSCVIFPYGTWLSPAAPAKQDRENICQERGPFQMSLYALFEARAYSIDFAEYFLYSLFRLHFCKSWVISTLIHYSVS